VSLLLDEVSIQLLYRNTSLQAHGFTSFVKVNVSLGHKIAELLQANVTC